MVATGRPACPRRRPTDGCSRRRGRTIDASSQHPRPVPAENTVPIAAVDLTDDLCLLNTPNVLKKLRVRGRKRLHIWTVCASARSGRLVLSHEICRSPPTLAKRLGRRTEFVPANVPAHQLKLGPGPGRQLKRWGPSNALGTPRDDSRRPSWSEAVPSELTARQFDWALGSGWSLLERERWTHKMLRNLEFATHTSFNGPGACRPADRALRRWSSRIRSDSRCTRT